MLADGHALVFRSTATEAILDKIGNTGLPRPQAEAGQIRIPGIEDPAFRLCLSRQPINCSLRDLD